MAQSWRLQPPVVSANRIIQHAHCIQTPSTEKKSILQVDIAQEVWHYDHSPPNPIWAHDCTATGSGIRRSGPCLHSTHECAGMYEARHGFVSAVVAALAPRRCHASIVACRSVAVAEPGLPQTRAQRVHAVRGECRGRRQSPACNAAG